MNRVLPISHIFSLIFVVRPSINIKRAERKLGYGASEAILCLTVCGWPNTQAIDLLSDPGLRISCRLRHIILAKADVAIDHHLYAGSILGDHAVILKGRKAFEYQSRSASHSTLCRSSSLVLVWDSHPTYEPKRIASDQLTSLQTLADYARRMRIEITFWKTIQENGFLAIILITVILPETWSISSDSPSVSK
jgi:hypothetical protein